LTDPQESNDGDGQQEDDAYNEEHDARRRGQLRRAEEPMGQRRSGARSEESVR
jgi:hypothetical protein